MSQTKEISMLTKVPTGAGSPEQAAAVAVAADASETERLVKLITAMGYPESEARLSLARSSNNVQKAVQLLVEGDDEEDGNGESRRRRRCRRSLKKVRSTLLGDPCVTDDAIVQLMRQQSTVQALTEMIRESSDQVMQLLLAQEDSEAEVLEEQLERKGEGEKEEEEEEEESLEEENTSPGSSAEGSPPSN
ncbi:hypothetical protein KR200_011228 [Drosophila serrata]|nr:hypothetical protein KR200_011228 [Drosophila serrata]